MSESREWHLNPPVVHIFCIRPVSTGPNCHFTKPLIRLILTNNPKTITIKRKKKSCLNAVAGHSNPRAAAGWNRECRPVGTLQHKELSNAICLKQCIQCFLQMPPSVPQNPHDYSDMLGDVQNTDLEAVQNTEFTAVLQVNHFPQVKDPSCLWVDI